MPYVLCLVDLPNLHNSYEKKYHKNALRNETYGDILKRMDARVKYLHQRPCLIYTFVQKHLVRGYPQLLPSQETSDFIVKWYEESRLKGDQRKGEEVDVDPQMIAEGTCQFKDAGTQISRFILMSGDKDMEVLLKQAKKRKIPITIVAIHKDNIAQELYQYTKDVITLYGGDK